MGVGIRDFFIINCSMLGLIIDYPAGCKRFAIIYHIRFV